MKRRSTILCLLSLCCAPLFAVPRVTAADQDKAAALVAQMTLDEKIELISGKIDGFRTYAVPRLGIPSIRMADGPQGVRNIDGKHIQSTFFPCGVSAAATWNRDVVREMGAGIGSAAKAHGVQIMLGPGVNIYRSALCGRNYEYYGEDPFLTGEIALSYIQGMQEEGVMATIKHFALNQQEYDRHGASSNVDERTMNEIYFPAFRKAVEKGDVACVMTSYNPVNGTHAVENPWLVRQNLRAWGFDGIVMSDWSSTYNCLNFMTSGVDFEMPRNWVTYPENVNTLLENGVVLEEALDEKCRNILASFIAWGFLDASLDPDASAEDPEVSRRRAYEIALEGPVLLKNENAILPLKPGKKNLIAVIGPNANTIVCGGGSGNVTPEDGKGVTLIDGLEKLGKGWNVKLLGTPQPDILRSAAAVVVAIGFNKTTERESHDRLYTLDQDQNDLVRTVAAYNPNVVVIANSGGEFDIAPWVDCAKAVILDWYPGQEGGNALAAILSGRISPSGKLPFTFWGSLEANPAQQWYDSYMVRAKPNRDFYPCIDYKEGVFLGYRGVQHFGVTPMYPFGYGLSYSKFEYNDAVVTASGDGFDVSFTVRNTGNYDAMETAEVYVAPVAPSVLRPERELKGFDKKRIPRGGSAQYSIHLGTDAFSYYDIHTHAWKVDPGKYNILIGASSEDIRLETSIEVL